MTVGLLFVTIEVEELGLGKVHFGGDLINLVGPALKKFIELSLLLRLQLSLFKSMNGLKKYIFKFMAELYSKFMAKDTFSWTMYW